MRVLVCGDRNWTDRAKIERELSKRRKEISFVIEGEAKGADRLGKEVAESFGLRVKKFPANWAQFHRAAGPIRNQQMLDEGHPDLVLAFHSNIEESKGTADMIRRAKKAGVKVILFKSKGG